MSILKMPVQAHHQLLKKVPCSVSPPKFVAKTQCTICVVS